MVLGERASQQGSPEDKRGSFLITIDTEGDDLWSKPTEITVRNAESLPRFQTLCARYGLKPTYLANWEMVNSPMFVEFGRDIIRNQTGEVGMHLHAWHSPPNVPLTADDYRFHPYLTEYPEEVIREKVHVMTDELENAFGVKMTSHRAGRWGFDETYLGALIGAGYRVDCSVTPHRDWTPVLGDPAGKGGPDYRAFPDIAYFMDREAIHRPGSSPVLQVPVTVMPLHDSYWAELARNSLGRVPYARRIVYRRWPKYSWLRPTGKNGRELLHVLETAKRQQRDYVEFMLHSSELMAGGSPTFRTERDIDALYEDLEALFAAAANHWEGKSLQEYHDEFVAKGQSPGSSTA